MVAMLADWEILPRDILHSGIDKKEI